MSPTEEFEEDESGVKVERACTTCGRMFLMSLESAAEIPPDSEFSFCPLCFDLLVARGQMHELIARVEAGEPLDDPE